MRMYEFITEAIAMPPRNLGHYINQRIKDVDWCIGELNKAEEMVAANVNGEDMLRQFLKYGSDYADAAHDVDSFVYLIARAYNGDSRLERYLPLNHLRHNLASYAQHGSDFLRYVTDSFKYAEAFDERVRAVIAILHVAEEGARQYGYDDHAEKDEEYHQAMGLLKGLQRACVVIHRAEQVWADLSDKLALVAEKSAAQRWGKGYRPKHAEVEELYHASIHAAELTEIGFQAEKPEGRTGVGNFGSQSEISFTHDYKIAQDIVRCLKELWMIAHGEVNTKTILGWMRAEGIDYKDPKFISTLGIGEKSIEKVGNHDVERWRTKQPHELTDPKDIAKLYNLYLWHTKLRSNPVFANLEELIVQLKKVELNDIGIVVCQVRLNQDTEYLSGESEFRVAADRVESIKRVL